jgi:hypothetical protein
VGPSGQPNFSWIHGKGRVGKPSSGVLEKPDHGAVAGGHGGDQPAADVELDVVGRVHHGIGEGRFEDLLALLDPQAVLRADGVTVRMGATAEVRGRQAVAETGPRGRP